MTANTRPFGSLTSHHCPAFVGELKGVNFAYGKICTMEMQVPPTVTYSVGSESKCG